MSKKLILFLTIILASFICFIPQKIEAQTLRDLYNDLDSLKAKKSIQDKNKNETELEKLNTNKEIQTALREIENCSNKIDLAEKKIEEYNTEIAEKKEEIEKLMRGLQVSNGGNAYLEYVFGATSFTDFIYRSAIVEQLSSYNDELIDEMYSLIEENKKLQIEMASKKTELESLYKTLNKKLSELDASLDDISDLQLSLADQIKLQEKLINDYEKHGCDMDQELSDCLDIPLGTNFIRPLNQGYLSSLYGPRSIDLYGNVERFHDGIDLGGNPEWTPVYAAAPGVVSLKWAYRGCGGFRIYLSHSINGVSYTTKYLHLIGFGNVEFGDVVTTNTIIGYVGGGSTSTKRGGYDKCTDGAHLHFSMGEGLYSTTKGSSNITWFDPMNTMRLSYKGQKFSSR